MSEIEDRQSERRRKPRIHVRWPAVCFWDGRDPFDAEVIDVSEDGFGLMGPDIHLAPGSTLTVEFERIGLFECQLIWAKDGRFGVRIKDKAAPDYDQLTSALLAIENNLSERRGKTG